MTQTARQWLRAIACAATLSVASSAAVNAQEPSKTMNEHIQKAQQQVECQKFGTNCPTDPGAAWVTVYNEFMAHDHAMGEKRYLPSVRYECNGAGGSGEIESWADQPFCASGATVYVDWEQIASAGGTDSIKMFSTTISHKTYGDENGYCAEGESPIWSMMRCKWADAGICSELVQHAYCKRTP